MKNKTLIILVMLCFGVNAQIITFSDLSPTGIHDFCIYNASGYLKSCYNQTIDFSDPIYDENNHTYYFKIMPNKYDIGFTGNIMISYIAALIPLGLFLLMLSVIVGLCLVIIFMFLRRGNRG